MVNGSAGGVIWPDCSMVTMAVPGLATKLAGTTAVNCVELTYVVESPEPFQVTNVKGDIPVPFTVSVKPGDPASLLFGEMLDSVNGADVIVNVSDGGASVVGSVTPTVAVPGDTIKLAGIVVVS